MCFLFVFLFPDVWLHPEGRLLYTRSSLEFLRGVDEHALSVLLGSFTSVSEFLLDYSKAWTYGHTVAGVSITPVISRYVFQDFVSLRKIETRISLYFSSNYQPSFQPFDCRWPENHENNVYLVLNFFSRFIVSFLSTLAPDFSSFVSSILIIFNSTRFTNTENKVDRINNEWPRFKELTEEVKGRSRTVIELRMQNSRIISMFQIVMNASFISQQSQVLL